MPPRKLDLQSYGIALGGGLLISLGQPGVGLWPTTVLGFASLSWLALRSQPSRMIGPAIAASIIVFAPAGLGFVRWGAPAVAVVWVTVALSLVLWAVLLSALIRRVESAPARAGLAAGLWVAIEGLYQHFAPWHLGAHLASLDLLLWPARFGGGLLLSAEIVFAAALLALARRRVLVGSAIAAVVGLQGLVGHLLPAPDPESSLRVAAIQPVITSDAFRRRVSEPAISQQVGTRLDLLLQAAVEDGADLVALPEGGDGRFAFVVLPLRERLQALARQSGSDLIVPTNDLDAVGAHVNAAYLVKGGGEIAGKHEKWLLMPGGEDGLRAGGAPTVLRGKAAYGVSICLEALFPGHARELVDSGADVLVTVTGDESFGTSVIPHWHLAVSTIRAVERGRPLIFASNAGPSVILDVYGRARATAPFAEAGAIFANLRPERGVSLWHLVGQFVHPLIVIALFAVTLVRRRRRETAVEPPRGSVPLVTSTVAFLCAVAIGVAVSWVHGAVQRSPERVFPTTQIPLSSAWTPLRTPASDLSQSFALMSLDVLRYLGYQVTLEGVESRVRELDVTPDAAGAMRLFGSWGVRLVEVTDIVEATPNGMGPVMGAAAGGKLGVVHRRVGDQLFLYQPQQGRVRSMDLSMIQPHLEWALRPVGR